MNLTALRRVVLAGNAVALGLAAWSTHGVLWAVEPLKERDWAALFPAKPANSAEVVAATKDPLADYLKDAGWPQGEKPKPPEPVAENTGPPPPPPLAQKYALRTVWEGATLFSSFAQLGRNGDANAMGISVRVGSVIVGPDPKADPTDADWLLDNVSLKPDGKVTATFRNLKSGERVTLEGAGMVATSEFKIAGAAPGGRDLQEAGGAPPAAAPRPVARLVRSDPVRGTWEWELPQEDADWFGGNLDDEAKKISTQVAKGADGQPDGIILKAVPASSRLSEFGFQGEDRVISVNDEKVNSVDHAIEVGKRQYEDGKGTFIVKVDRAGKILNFTFRAPPKKK